MSACLLEGNTVGRLEQVALTYTFIKSVIRTEAFINGRLKTIHQVKFNGSQGKPEAMEAPSFGEDIADSAGRRAAPA